MPKVASSNLAGSAMETSRCEHSLFIPLDSFQDEIVCSKCGKSVSYQQIMARVLKNGGPYVSSQQISKLIRSSNGGFR